MQALSDKPHGDEAVFAIGLANVLGDQSGLEIEVGHEIERKTALLGILRALIGVELDLHVGFMYTQ